MYTFGLVNARCHSEPQVLCCSFMDASWRFFLAQAGRSGYCPSESCNLHAPGHGIVFDLMWNTWLHDFMIFMPRFWYVLGLPWMLWLREICFETQTEFMSFSLWLKWCQECHPKWGELPQSNYAIESNRFCHKRGHLHSTWSRQSLRFEGKNLGCEGEWTLACQPRNLTFQAIMCLQLATSSGTLFHWISSSSSTDWPTFGFWLFQLCRCCLSRSPPQHLGQLWCPWWVCSLWPFAKMPMRTSSAGVTTAGWTIKAARCARSQNVTSGKRSSGRRSRWEVFWSYIAISRCLLTSCNLPFYDDVRK